MGNCKNNSQLGKCLFAALFMLMSSASYSASTNDSVRVQASQSSSAAEKAQQARAKSSINQASKKSNTNSVDDFAIVWTDTLLEYDFDADKYYEQFTLFFDVDTVFASAEIYADIWLRPLGGDWELIHTTDVFTIYADEADDAYEVITTLQGSFFVADEYDIGIDIYEYGFEGVVAATDGEFDDALALLPLEADIYNQYHDGYDVVVVEHSGGGSLGIGFLLLVLVGLLVRRKIRFSQS